MILLFIGIPMITTMPFYFHKRIKLMNKLRLSKINKIRFIESELKIKRNKKLRLTEIENL